MERLANFLTDYCVANNIVEKDKEEIYLYGFKLIIADVINYTIIILLGIILRTLAESIVFMMCLCILRRYCGGFHAKTFWVCRLSMVTTYLCVMFLSKQLIEAGNMTFIVAPIDIASIIFISLFAPVEHPNKPLSNKQKQKNRIKAIITSVLLTIVSISFVAVNIKTGVTISITLLAVIILMIISMAIQKGGTRNV